MRKHVVVLVPGFMGFGRFASLYYFAERVLAAVRGALETRLPSPVPVVGVQTDPVGSLFSRQRILLAELARLRDRIGPPVAFHLVGHSTGGVDAELLTCTLRLAREGGERQALTPDWGEHAALRGDIASVTTLSAPHYGTCLADSPAAGWLAHPLSAKGALEAAQLGGSLGRLLLSRTLTLDGLGAALLSAPQGLEFVRHFLTCRRLLLDLRPDRMIALRRDNPPDPALGARVRCIVSVAPPEAVPGAQRACDGFYARLHALTAEYAARRPAAETERFAAVLDAHLGERIGNPQARLTPFGPETSDGIVNSARQVLETHAGGDAAAALGGIVVGDHGDVLGHYDREDELTDGPVLDHGFFRSGAGFGDDVFFALWNRVADHIAAAVMEPPSALPRSGT
jgi:hypothetical protein